MLRRMPPRSGAFGLMNLDPGGSKAVLSPPTPRKTGISSSILGAEFEESSAVIPTLIMTLAGFLGLTGMKARRLGMENRSCGFHIYKQWDARGTNNIPSCLDLHESPSDLPSTRLFFIQESAYAIPSPKSLQITGIAPRFHFVYLSRWVPS
jgi:hypothetical protein